jgi:ATP-dependent helicase IRC3
MFYDPNHFKTIIVDEAHHAAAQSYLRIINHFKVGDPNSRMLLCTLYNIKK